MIAKFSTGGKGWMAVLFRMLSVAIPLLGFTLDSHAASVKQLLFSSPEEAVEYLVNAVRANDEKGMLGALGPEGKDLIASGDEIADRSGREKFLASYDKSHIIENKAPNTAFLQTGADSWALPIPIVKKKGRWLFDTGKGKQEILNRRIGRNELHVMETMHAYVEAQHEYATKDCSACGKVVFAQRLISTPGKRDGLYWEAKEGDDESPLGPLVAHAAEEGYTSVGLSPFHGYYFKILKGQGKHAKGGAYNYVVKGKMLLGFALVAYPAEYGNSGVMTFIVNQNGDIYQKNLGKKSRQIGEALKIFDPDKSWKKLEEGAKHQ